MPAYFFPIISLLYSNSSHNIILTYTNLISTICLSYPHPSSLRIVFCVCYLHYPFIDYFEESRF